MDRIEIIDPNTGNLIVFPCGKWLSKDKEDGEIERDLFPVVENGVSRDSSRVSSSPNSRRHQEFDNRRVFDRDDRDRDSDRYGSSRRESFRSFDNKKERDFSFETNMRQRGERDLMSRGRDNYRHEHSVRHD